MQLFALDPLLCTAAHHDRLETAVAVCVVSPSQAPLSWAKGRILPAKTRYASIRGSDAPAYVVRDAAFRLANQATAKHSRRCRRRLALLVCVGPFAESYGSAYASTSRGTCCAWSELQPLRASPHRRCRPGLCLAASPTRLPPIAPACGPLGLRWR